MHYLSSTPPIPFFPEMEVAICLCECKNKNLFLRRHPQKPYGGEWAAPGGKIEKGETPGKAVVREVFEETGIVIPEEQLISHGKYYIDTKEVQFIMYIFQAKLEEFPEIDLRLEEHIEFRWLPPAEALSLPLMFGADECLGKVYETIRK